MSRRELCKRATELSEQLGRRFENDRHTNSELSELVASLEADVSAQGEGPSLVEREAEIKSAAEAAKLQRLNTNVNEFTGEALRFPYQVAPRKQLKCRFGLLLSGAEVRAEYVGGLARLAKLVDSGAVLRAPSAKR